MRRILKHIVSFFLVPITRWYLRKERVFLHKGVEFKIQPGVFHPGLFRSTVLLLEYLSTQTLMKSTFLELGSGSGVISVVAAKAGAEVTAIDLSELAVNNTTCNALINGVNVRVVLSDLFDHLEKKVFDWIVINPPYYPHAPKKVEDLAWYCGKDFEYFRKLFNTMEDYMYSNSHVIMVFTLSKELELILQLGRDKGFGFELLQKKRSFLDGYDVLYRIHKIKYPQKQA